MRSMKYISVVVLCMAISFGGAVYAEQGQGPQSPAPTQPSAPSTLQPPSWLEVLMGVVQAVVL